MQDLGLAVWRRVDKHGLEWLWLHVLSQCHAGHPLLPSSFLAVLMPSVSGEVEGVHILVYARLLACKIDIR